MLNCKFDELDKLNCKFDELDKLMDEFDELDKLNCKFDELDKLNCKFDELDKNFAFLLVVTLKRISSTFTINHSACFFQLEYTFKEI